MTPVHVKALRDFNSTTDLAMAHYFVGEDEPPRVVVDGRYASRQRKRMGEFGVPPEAVKAIIRPLKKSDEVVAEVDVHAFAPRKIFDAAAMLGKTPTGQSEVIAVNCGGDLCAVTSAASDGKNVVGIPNRYGFPNFHMK